MTRVPHLHVVVAVCCYVFAGWSLISAWVLFYSGDQSLISAIISTWQNFALLAVGFWLGSSSGGKSGNTGSTISESRIVTESEPDARSGSSHSTAVSTGTTVTKPLSEARSTEDRSGNTSGNDDGTQRTE